LNRLSQRISQSSLPMHSSHCARCGRAIHNGMCLSKAASTEQLSKKHKHARQLSAAQVRKVQLYNASAPQLAMVKSRPHNRRKDSSSSANSSLPSPPPSYKSLPAQSPPISGHPPPPEYTPSPALADPRHLRKANPSAPPPIPRKPTKYRTEAAKLAQANPPFQQPFASSPIPRRTDKVTPSVYTFASDSTKLGEIPMDRWAVPYDWGAAERGNLAAAMLPPRGPPGVVLEGKGGGGKRGLFKGLFKKKDPT
jgi:hypothetical protein